MDETTSPAPGQAQSGWLRYARSAFIYVILLIAFGIFLPLRKGLDFFDPVLLSAYACMGVIFAGPAAAQAFENRPESVRQALVWIATAVGFGEAIAIAMLAAGLLTVRLTVPILPFGPDVASLTYSLLLGLAASVALASLGAVVALRFSSGAARVALRVLLLGLVAAFFLESRSLPEAAGAAAVVATAAAVLFLGLLLFSLGRT